MSLIRFQRLLLLGSVFSIICMADTPFEQALRSVGVPPAEIASVLERTNVRNASKVSALRDWLLRQGVGQADIGGILSRYPTLLNPDIDRVLNPHVQWLRDQGISRSDIVRIIVRQSSVLWYSIEDTLNPHVQWLLNQGVKQKDVPKIITRAPQILHYSIENLLNPHVRWLREQGVPQEQIGILITRAPNVLGMDLERTLNPHVQWLRTQGVSKDDIGRIIVRHPQILTYDIEEHLNPHVTWLRNQGVRQVDIGKFITRMPQIFSYSIEQTLAPHIQWLQSKGLDRVQIATMITAFPAILSYDVQENLTPTWALLTERFGLTKEEIAARPLLLGTSLSRTELIADWAEAAGVRLSDLSLNHRADILMSSSLEGIIDNFKWLLERLRSSVPDPQLRRQTLAQVIPQLQDRSWLRQLLTRYRNSTAQTTALSRCLESLEHIVPSD